MSAKITKLLVRQRDSKEFLEASGGWTKREEAAYNFPNFLIAINTSIAKGLENVEVIVRCDGDSDDRCYRLNQP